MAEMYRPNRLVIGISGASGAAIAIELLKQMQAQTGWETHLVISAGARRTIRMETAFSVEEVEALATECHPLEDVGASIASGTFPCAGMVVAPCSMKTVSGIAHGFSDNLLLRAADVAIKERRKLVLVARESPLSPIHLGNLLLLANLGAIVLPPVLTYYNRPASIDDMTRHVVGKILDAFGLEATGFSRWGERMQELPEAVHVA
jgi:polyprenyl P-hydroxybenzoate/phenylacrylic acid decarboxylase-like protein